MEKAVWITGASSGIGRETARLFASRGINVIASARREEKLLDLAEENKDSPGKIIPLTCDVSLPFDVSETCAAITEDYEIEALINNAGVTSFKPFEMNSVEEIDSILNTNLFGAIYTAKSVLPGMIKGNGGKIINISSAITEKVFTNSSVYSASKSGLLAFMNVLREEVRKYNIRVINITPGATDTEIWRSEIREKFSERMMKPAEIAEMVYFAYSLNGNAVVENIITRPVKGDL
jgi:short-subunit dehydrogenase